ncbi:hypothetical protein CBL_10480 [Carabus blaptoides fortunei]
MEHGDGHLYRYIDMHARKICVFVHTLNVGYVHAESSPHGIQRLCRRVCARPESVMSTAHMDLDWPTSPGIRRLLMTPSVVQYTTTSTALPVSASHTPFNLTYPPTFLQQLATPYITTTSSTTLYPPTVCYTIP